MRLFPTKQSERDARRFPAFMVVHLKQMNLLYQMQGIAPAETKKSLKSCIPALNCKTLKPSILITGTGQKYR
jgi:hypothetical protein